MANDDEFGPMALHVDGQEEQLYVKEQNVAFDEHVYGVAMSLAKAPLFTDEVNGRLEFNPQEIKLSQPDTLLTLYANPYPKLLILKIEGILILNCEDRRIANGEVNVTLTKPDCATAVLENTTRKFASDNGAKTIINSYRNIGNGPIKAEDDGSDTDTRNCSTITWLS